MKSNKEDFKRNKIDEERMRRQNKSDLQLYNYFIMILPKLYFYYIVILQFFFFFFDAYFFFYTVYDSVEIPIILLTKLIGSLGYSFL